MSALPVVILLPRVTAPAPFCKKAPERVIVLLGANVQTPELVIVNGPPVVVVILPAKVTMPDVRPMPPDPFVLRLPLKTVDTPAAWAIAPAVMSFVEIFPALVSVSMPRRVLLPTFELKMISLVPLLSVKLPEPLTAPKNVIG